MTILPDNIYWDGETNQYRYKKSDRALGSREPQKLHIKEVLRVRKWSDKQVDRLVSGELSFLDFQRAIATSIKDLKIESLEFAKGGKPNTFAIDYLAQARHLRNIDYPSLRNLFDQIANGNHSVEMIKHRLGNFYLSSRQALEQGRQAIAETNQLTHMVRVLADAEHCAECIAYAEAGVQPIGGLPLPTEQCSCTYNCKCSVIYLTLSQAIERQAVMVG